jgi:hypothetical protein
MDWLDQADQIEQNTDYQAAEQSELITRGPSTIWQVRVDAYKQLHRRHQSLASRSRDCC